MLFTIKEAPIDGPGTGIALDNIITVNLFVQNNRVIAETSVLASAVS